jgi:hypothetical protein
MAEQSSPMPSGESKTFNTEEHLALYKFKTITEIKEEIVGWAQVRLALLTTLLSLLILTGSFVGIRLMVHSYIDQEAKEPVTAQIKAISAIHQQARDGLERLKIQSEQVNNMSVQTQHELSRLKGEAEFISKLVREIEPAIKSATQELQRIKEGAALSTQFLQEQALKSKADMFEMRNSVELLHAGFGIIERLAAEIKQKDPQSELARQFAGFSAQWHSAREAFERQAQAIKLRRNIKIIHYLREGAPKERHQMSKRLVDVLASKGYVVEGWAEPNNDEVKAALAVADRFGVAAKTLMQPVIVVTPDSSVDIDDLVSIAKTIGIELPQVRRHPFTPQMKEILAGGENGSFAASNFVLIAELADAN